MFEAIIATYGNVGLVIGNVGLVIHNYKGAGFPLQYKHWSFQSEELMKYFLKTACILLLSISFIHSTYSQTLSLERLVEQKAGLEFVYNQTRFENLSRDVDVTDHNAHLAIPVRLNNFSKLSIMPCLSYKNTKSGDTIEADLNAGCYLRYTSIYEMTRPNLFFRLGGGGNSNTPDDTESTTLEGGGNSNTPDDTDPLTWMWKGHVGGGTFWDLNKSAGVPIKLFSGLFLQGEFERRIEKSMNHNSKGLDLSAEFGVEIKFLEKQSLSVTCSIYLFNTYGVSNLYPKFYFSLRVL